MTKFLFLIMAILSIFGCSSSENDPEADMLLSNNNLIINCKSDDNITVSGVDINECKAESSDDFIAEPIIYMGKINISGNHVGKATITVTYKKQSQKCEINVMPLYNYVGEPITSLGINKNELKSKVNGNIQHESDNSIEYKEESSIYDTYYFKNNQLVLVCSQIEINYSLVDIANSLIERYDYISSTSNISWYQKTGLMVRMNERGGNGGYRIIYAKDADTMSEYYSL